MKDFELISHTADLKLRVYGVTLEKLFSHALKGMFHSIHPRSLLCTWHNDRLTCSSLPRKHILDLTASDSESLLVDFLSEALYLSDAHDEAYLDATINLKKNHLRATIYGVPIEGFDDGEIKAVTYHDLAFEKKDGLWQTDIVFDI